MDDEALGRDRAEERRWVDMERRRHLGKVRKSDGCRAAALPEPSAVDNGPPAHIPIACAKQEEDELGHVGTSATSGSRTQGDCFAAQPAKARTQRCQR